MKFSCPSGSRPLDGYTLKRGIGIGGFGEVYFGLTDGGKEVAMKLIRNNLEMELRGMTQCLNLKHSNLVDLYDIRMDDDGQYWVIMEYIAGESLDKVLARHPNGVAPDLARQWFLGIANGIGYLHEQGIVHRDLKPGNIFFENGSIKIGDFGLCKCISENHRSAQSRNTGTAYYMAPEISTGNYNRQIDIYAAGIVLYEMLTGTVPFDGESVPEVLTRHMTDRPDMSNVPDAYVPILSRALAKNTAHRYKTMREFVRDVEAIGLENTIPVIVPTKPLYKANQIPENVTTKDSNSQPPPSVVPAPDVPAVGSIGETAATMLKALPLLAICSVLWGLLIRTSDVAILGQFFFLSVVTTWSVLAASRFWSKRVPESLSRRAALMFVGGLVGVFALWISGQPVPELIAGVVQANETSTSGSATTSVSSTREQLTTLLGYVAFFAIPFFLMRWWELTDRRRKRRFSLYFVVGVGLLSYLMTAFWPGNFGGLGLMTFIVTAVVVQLVSPWEPIKRVPVRKLRLPNA